MFWSHSLANVRSVSCSHGIVKSNVSVSINLQQVVVFGKDKDGKSACRSVGKIYFDEYVALFYQLETDFTRIHLRCEIKSKQCTTVLILFSRNTVVCVAIIQTKITSNKAVVDKVRLQGFGRDLNTITIKCHEIDAVVLKIEKRFGDDPVVMSTIPITIRVGNYPKNKFFSVMLRFPDGTVKLLTSTRRIGYFAVPCCKALP